MDKQYTKTIEYNGEDLTFKLGRLAPRAESTVWAQVGDTVVMTIVSVSKEDTTLDYFPLSIEYVEKFYAGGRISGSRFQKRERWPSDDAVLKARQVDHSIRSLFPKGFKKEVSVIITVLAYDGVHDPETLAVTSASMALMNSRLPFFGPVASVMVGVKEGEFILNPSNEKEDEDLDAKFIVSIRGEDRVLNIEGFGDEIPEEKMFELLDFASKNVQPLLKIQEELAKESGVVRTEAVDNSIDKEFLNAVDKEFGDRISEGLYNKDERDEIFAEVKKDVAEKNADNEELTSGMIDEAVEYVARKIMRAGVLSSDKRTSGRKLDEIRELSIEVGVLPRVHGSALFQRGLTQCLSILTLGSTRLVQQLESFEGEDDKHWMHHYNGPNYSLGQAGRFGFIPGRREVGHGNIGENALLKMMPSIEDFPYTIRAVSEILSQQGSSSMAATCGTTLALMDAGVPIKAPVAGIALGLVTEDDNENVYKLLVDAEDVEDFYGDMDFKVTGTTKGVTAIQLDNKLRGVPVKILKEAFMVSKKARLEILEKMSAVIGKPRADLSDFAPKVESIKIKKEKIGELIGPGGKVIKGIMEKAGGSVDIDINDDGVVTVTAINTEERDIAMRLINEVIEEAEVGKVYEGEVASVKDYGVFVDVTSNISGLVHKSEMSDKFVSDPNEFAKVGEKVKVKVIKIENGRISFSMKGLN